MAPRASMTEGMSRTRKSGCVFFERLFCILVVLYQILIFAGEISEEHSQERYSIACMTETTIGGGRRT